MKKELTHREVVSKGGKARWHKISKKARSEAMKKVRSFGVKRPVDKLVDKLARQE